MGQWGSSGMLWGGGVAEAVYPGYHLILGGVGLLLAPGGYERRLGQQYAAKLSTARLSQSDRINDQALILDSWEGGEGYLRHETSTPDRYRRGAGINVYADAGAVGLGPRMTAPAALQTSQNELPCMIVYRGFLMIGAGDGKVYRWNGTTLDLAIDTAKAGGIRSFAIWETNLYAGNGTDGEVWRWVGSTLLTSFASNFTVGAYSGGTVNGVHCLTPFIKGSFLSAEYGASSTNNAMFGEWVNTGGTTSSSTSGTLIAHEARATVLVPYNNTLVAVAADTTNKTWRLYEGNSDAATDWEFKVAGEGGYPLCAAVLDDRLYLGDAVGGRIWRWDGNDLELYHQIGTEETPYTHEIRGMVAWRGALWIGIADTDGTMAILRLTSSRNWSRPVTGLTGTTPGVLCVFEDRLHYVTNATGASKVWRTDGTLAGTGYVESGLIGANLTGTDKLWVGVKVNHSALVSPQTVEVQYKLEDTGSWVSLGTSSTVGATSAEFDFPAAITAEHIAFKIILTGTAGSSTQLKVFSLVGRYKPAPGAKRQWSLEVLLHKTANRDQRLQDGTLETRTGEEISAELWALVNEVDPVNLVDLDRQEYTVQIEDYSETPDLTGVDGLNVGYTFKGSLRLVEV